MPLKVRAATKACSCKLVISRLNPEVFKCFWFNMQNLIGDAEMGDTPGRAEIKEERKPQVFYHEIQNQLDRKPRNFFSVDACIQMRDSKRRARLWIADVKNTKKKQRTGSTSQNTAVPRPPSYVLYMLALWEKPTHMERVAAECLIKA